MVPIILDTGDTAWMLVSTALVMLMTVLGLALFYSGLVKKETVLNTLFLSFSAYAFVSIIWLSYNTCRRGRSDSDGKTSPRRDLSVCR